MFNIILGLIALLALIILDKQVDFQDRKKLSLLYYGINIFIVGLAQYFYGTLVVDHPNLGDLFYSIKNFYYLGMALIFIVLFIMESLRARGIKSSYPVLLTAGLYLVLAKLGAYIVIVIPLLPTIVLAKGLVALFYPNISLNFVLSHKYHLDQGYDNLPVKTPYHKLFYRGDFFQLDLLNRLYTFFTPSYILRAQSKVLIYASENIDDQFNLMTIVEHYERQESGYVVFNKIERSINNRYGDSDVFRLDQISEIADGEFFKDYLASRILDYPRVDFEYRLYLVDLSIFKLGENFRLFQLNREEIQENKIVKQYEIPMENLKDDDKISNYLNKLIEKDLIYNQIEGYLNKGYENKYRFKRTDRFSLGYDEGIRCFMIYSDELGLIGRLNKEETDPITNINLPVYNNIVMERDQVKGDYQKYGLFAQSQGEEKPYDLYINFYVEVDFTRLEELGRPEFKLIGKFNIDLSI